MCMYIKAIAIKITTDANLPIEKPQEVMERINNMLINEPGRYAYLNVKYQF